MNKCLKGTWWEMLFDSCCQGSANGNLICTAYVQVHPAWQTNRLNCTSVLKEYCGVTKTIQEVLGIYSSQVVVGGEHGLTTQDSVVRYMKNWL